MAIWIESPFDSLPIEGYRKQRYWMMAEAFVRAGHRVVYWTSDFSHATKAKRKIVEAKGGTQTPDSGFRIVQIPTRPYPRNVCLRRILSHCAYARTWQRMAEEAVAAGEQRPDVVIVSSPPLATGAVGRTLARQFGAKFVVDVQDAWPETFYRLLPRGFRWLGRFLFVGMRRAAGEIYRAADLVTGVCDRYGPLVKGYGARDYYRAYLGIEGEVCGTRGAEDRSVCRLAYVGNLGVSYDLKTVVRGVELLNARGGPRVTLDVAGFGGCVAESETVRFHGMLNGTALRMLLSRCDIGIIPMKEDSYVGIPNKLAEYAAAGLAIVSSLGGETADLIAKYACGVTYRAGDAESFAVAVEQARQTSGVNCSRLLSEELSAERIYDSYCERIAAM